MKKIKLIWDFRGATALGTAKHHCIHLKEFVLAEKLTCHNISHTKINEMWSVAFMVVDEVGMNFFRDALKPHRAEVYQH